MTLGSPLGAAAFPSSVTAVGGSPGAVAVDPATHRVYAADPSGDVVSVFDGSLDAPTIGRVTVGTHPVALALDAVAGRVYVANADSATVSAFDADDPSSPATNLVSIENPSAVAVDPVSHTVYVTSSSENRLYWFTDSDSAAGTPVLQWLPVGREPSGVALDAVGHVVAVTNQGDNTVSVVTTAPSDDTSVPAGAGSAGSGSVGSGSAGSSTTRVTTVSVGASPCALAIDPSLHVAVVANLRGDTVSRFDVRASTPTVSTVAVGRAPRSVAIDPTTHNAFVANSLGLTVSQFAVGAASPPVMSLPLGKAPRGVAVDESRGTVFATNPLNGTVSGSPPLTPAAPTIVSAPPRVATVGVWYSHSVEARGTPAPTLSLVGSLPAGLSFDASTGQLSGTPTAAGSSTVTVRAHNLAGPDAVATYTVSALPKIAW
ncbi:hypothetical protein C5B96_09825 [Subtercola sp. Z020]|nr:hypothetical protein C5B96_09825 [Subtercola sp. Z020]